MIGAIACNLIGGLGLFMLGMRSLSEALQIVGADRLRRIITSATGGRWIALASGAVAAAIVQSSSVVAVLVVSLVNSGLLELVQAAALLLGANVGATIVGWVLILDLQTSALLILGIGAFLQFFAVNENTRFAGQLAAGLGMVFLGLTLMKAAATLTRDMPDLAQVATPVGWTGILVAVLAGALVTVLLQSANATLGLTIAFASSGVLTLDAAAALIVGGNVGATVAAQRAAIQGTTDARRAAMFHTIANLVASVIIISAFNPWLTVVDHLYPGDPNLVDASGARPFITGHIAAAHSSFNILLALFALPLIGPMVKLTGPLSREGRTEQTNLEFLHASMAESPTLAIEQGRLEVLHLAGITHDILHLTQNLYRQPIAVRSTIRDRILKKEKITDAIQLEITSFMSKLMPAVLTEAQTEEVRNLIRLANEIESIADYCERLANYRRRMQRMNVSMDAAAMHELNEYLGTTIAFYDEVVDRGRRKETDWMETVTAKSRELLETADGLRDRNLARLAAQRFEPDAGIFFNDMLVAMRRIRNHSVNIAEAFQGKK